MQILISTRNRHKVEEIRAILGTAHQLSTLADLPDAPAAVEDQETFEGNATRKAVTLASWLAARKGAIDYVLADDSGLEVDALRGAPGVHSARFAGIASGEPGNTPDQANNAKLLGLLAGVPLEQRTGRFRCVIAFTPVPHAGPESTSPSCSLNEAEFATLLFTGSCEGRILEAARGAHGFGYDPLFVPNGFEQSFAELGEEVKNRISHRSKALSKLKEFLAQGAA